MTDTTMPGPATVPHYPSKFDLVAPGEDSLPNYERSDKIHDISNVSAPGSMSSALDRLEASRRSLREALLDIAHPPTKPSLFSGSTADIGNKLLARARALPGVALAIESAESWWQDHPIHTAATVAAQTSGPILAPLARRHPRSLLLTAFGIGAALVLIRPWRMLLRPAVLIGAATQIARRAVKGTSASSWLQNVMSAFGTNKAGKKFGPSTAPR